MRFPSNVRSPLILLLSFNFVMTACGSRKMRPIWQSKPAVEQAGPQNTGGPVGKTQGTGDDDVTKKLCESNKALLEGALGKMDLDKYKTLTDAISDLKLQVTETAAASAAKDEPTPANQAEQATAAIATAPDLASAPPAASKGQKMTIALTMDLGLVVGA